MMSISILYRNNNRVTGSYQQVNCQQQLLEFVSPAQNYLHWHCNSKYYLLSVVKQGAYLSNLLSTECLRKDCEQSNCRLCITAGDLKLSSNVIVVIVKLIGLKFNTTAPLLYSSQLQNELLKDQETFCQSVSSSVCFCI